jgi:hypothetical protein
VCINFVQFNFKYLVAYYIRGFIKFGQVSCWLEDNIKIYLRYAEYGLSCLADGPVVGFCEHCDEPSGPVIREFSC